MQNKRIYEKISIALFFIGAFLIINEQVNITGAVIGFSGQSGFSAIIGFCFIIVSVILPIVGKDLGDSVLKLADEYQWKPYRINTKSIIQDIEQEYLLLKKEDFDTNPDFEKMDEEKINKWVKDYLIQEDKPSIERTPIQERIERMITGEKLIGISDKREDYKERFYGGHTSQGGRVIEVDSHISNGKFIHFGEPANSTYIWTIDEDGNFIVANRKIMVHDLSQIGINLTDLIKIEKDYNKNEVDIIVNQLEISKHGLTNDYVTSEIKKMIEYTQGFKEDLQSKGPDGKIRKGDYEKRKLNGEIIDKNTIAVKSEFNSIEDIYKKCIKKLTSISKNIDYHHKLHKLPHPTIARGRKVYGSGEVLIEGGLIREVNTLSGHYFPIEETPAGKGSTDYNESLIDAFNEQGIEVFKELSKKYGWKEVKNGAEYKKKGAE